MARLYATRAERDLDEARRRLKETGKVSCLGPEGSFSERAAREMRADYAIELCHSFGEAVDLLLEGKTDYAVLPIENSLNGAVRQNLDLLEREEIFCREEHALPVDQRLATLEGVRAEDVRVIYSHEQAIAQCSEYLRAKFPGVRYVFTASTVAGLDRLDGQSAGIVGAHVRREGVCLSAENIADNKQNFTRFVLVERGKGEGCTHSAMVFLCAVCAHKPGSLLGLLKIFQRHALNLTRIESRPVKESFGEYRFFIEFAGDIASERVRTALDEARNYCSQFKLLGAYD